MLNILHPLKQNISKLSKVKASFPLFVILVLFANTSDLKASINKILNGNFETGDLTGWTTTSPNPPPVPNGTFEIESFDSYFYRQTIVEKGLIYSDIEWLMQRFPDISVHGVTMI